MSEEHVFLLSPAKLDGKRAKMLFNPQARFELAQVLRSREGAALGDVYSFLSGLYFRGKVAYVHQFARHPTSVGAWAITPGGGLCELSERVTLSRLDSWQRVQISEHNPHFTAPLARHVSTLLDTLSQQVCFVLLGSVASNKYVLPLLELLGPRLVYPVEFAGLGDMSRGALLLRCAREGRELEYEPVSSLRTRLQRRPMP